MHCAAWSIGCASQCVGRQLAICVVCWGIIPYVRAGLIVTLCKLHKRIMFWCLDGACVSSTLSSQTCVVVLYGCATWEWWS